jgi:ribose transport system substrate-binding protein
MMITTRKVAVVAAIALALTTALAGCSSTGTSTTSTAKVNSAAIVKQIGSKSPSKSVICAGGKQYKLGYDAFSDTDSFSVVEWNSLQALAKSLGCVTVTRLIDNANATQAVQNANIFVQQKMSGVMLFNIIAAAAPGQAKVLKQAGIPALTVGIPAPGLPFITANESAAGKNVGSHLAQAFVAKHSSATPYVIVGRNDVVGQVGIDRMNGVVSGVESVLTNLPKSHILSIQAGDPATAQTQTQDVLGNVPAGSPILLSGINDDITYGMYRGVVQAGRQSDATVVTIGAVNPDGLNYICENKAFAGGVSYTPERFADWMIPAMIAEINGAKLPATMTIPTTYIGRNDIAQHYPKFTCGPI